MPTRRKVQRSLVVVALVASAILCAAPARRTEPGPGMAAAVRPESAPRLEEARHRERDRGRQADLMTVLAGPRGGDVFDPGGWGVFSPGGWGIFDPGGWGLQREQLAGVPGRLAERRRDGPPVDGDRPRDEDIFDPGGWGIVPLLAVKEAEIKTKSERGVVSIRITGEGRRAAERIKRLIRPGDNGMWLDVDRAGTPDEPGRPPRRGGDDGPGRRIAGSGQADPVPTEDFGRGVSPDVIDPVALEVIRDGVILNMQVPHPGAEKMKDAVDLQVKSVEKLAEALAGSMELSRVLRTGHVRTRWEKHSKGAALVFMGPDELRKAAEKLEDFAKYLDGKGDDIAEARWRTAGYFRPARRGPHAPPRITGPGPQGQGDRGRR